MEHIAIERYESRVIDNEVRFFAILKDGKEIEMPACYKEMYNDKHLAIRKQYVPFKELFDLKSEEHYIPLNTEAVRCPKKKAHRT